AATGNGKGHVQVNLAGNVGNDVIRILHFHIVVELNVASGNHARTLLVQTQGCTVLALQDDGNALQVQKDLDDIFLNAFNAAVLVQYTVDLGFDDGAARHGGEQDSTQGIAQGVTKAALERLQHDLGTGRAGFCHIDMTGGKKFVYSSLHSHTC